MGFGVYFTCDPSLAMNYGTAKVTDDYYLILTKVLVGDYCMHGHKRTRPPLKGARNKNPSWLENWYPVSYDRYESSDGEQLGSTNNVSSSQASGMKENKYDRYDCIVNDEQHPSVFVAFHDDQMLPEYVIRFRKRKMPVQENARFY